jgi:hypothetical protein
MSIKAKLTFAEIGGRFAKPGGYYKVSSPSSLKAAIIGIGGDMV